MVYDPGSFGGGGPGIPPGGDASSAYGSHPGASFTASGQASQNQTQINQTQIPWGIIVPVVILIAAVAVAES